jgi:hypothetical protein
MINVVSVKINSTFLTIVDTKQYLFFSLLVLGIFFFLIDLY